MSTLLEINASESILQKWKKLNVSLNSKKDTKQFAFRKFQFFCHMTELQCFFRSITFDDKPFFDRLVSEFIIACC